MKPAPQKTGAPTHPDYELAWAELRRRRRALLTAILSLLLWPLLVSLVRGLLGLTLGDWLPLSTLLILFAATGFTALRYHFFKCPRCRQAYFMNGIFGNSLTRHCLHC